MDYNYEIEQNPLILEGALFFPFWKKKKRQAVSDQEVQEQ